MTRFVGRFVCLWYFDPRDSSTAHTHTHTHTHTNTHLHTALARAAHTTSTVLSISHRCAVAAAENHPALVSRLLDAGADINHVTADGNFALAAAADAGNAEVVDLLLERGADATLTINGGPVADFASTPAIAAVLRNATGGTSGSTGGATAATATATATATPSAPATTLATADEPPATTSTGGDGAGTVAAAAVTLSSDLVVGSGAAAGATTNAAGEMVSDVYEACAQGDVMSVQLFLAARASAINEPDSEGRTPLVVAAQGGHTEVRWLMLFLMIIGSAFVYASARLFLLCVSSQFCSIVLNRCISSLFCGRW